MTKKKQSTSKKIALSTMTATMAVSGLAPTLPNTEAHASTTEPVTQPTNVMVTKNNGESLQVDWEKNGAAEGTQYYAMAHAKDAPTKTAFVAKTEELNNWSLNSKPYFETTNTSWYETGKVKGDNVLGFDVTIPEHALTGTFSFRHLTRSNDVLAVMIDGKQMKTLSGYGKNEVSSFALTPGDHRIELVYKNTLNQDYAGAHFVRELQVSYTYKDTVASGWVDGTSHTFEGLNKEKDYDVRLVAKKGDVRSPIQTASNATTVQYEAVPNGNKISWTPTTTGAVSYEVQRDGKSIYKGTNLSHVDTDVIGRTGYFYLVNAIDINGDVIESMYKRVTTPEYANVTGTPTVQGADLSWTYGKQGTNVGKFQVYRGEEMVYEGLDTSFLDREAFGGLSYDYTLKVLGDENQVLETDTLKVDMPVNAPKDIIVTRDDATEKDVIWNSNHNNPEVEYKAVAKPKTPVNRVVTFLHNNNGATFPASMNFENKNWRVIKPYWQTNSTTDLWFEPIDGVGTNVLSFDADIPLTAKTPKFEMSYSSVSSDVMEVKVNGVRKWSKSGLDRNGSNLSKKTMSIDLTAGMVNKIEVVFNNTNNTDYAGTSFVDDLKVSYVSDGSIESPWMKDSSYTLTGLDASKEYDVVVKARNEKETTSEVSGRTAVQLGLTQEAGTVGTSFDYLLDGVASYELKRDGETIYEGTDALFVDESTLGSKTYNYTLIAKDADGKTLGSTQKTVTTPNYVTATAEMNGSDVSLDMGYAKDRDITYTVTRNGETVYEGNKSDFVDNTAVGATNYTYVVTAKEEGNVVGTVTTSVRTPIATPTSLKVETTSDTSVMASWKDDKNPENTEYMVTATPLGEATPTIVEGFEDFEGSTNKLFATGGWSKTSSDKKSGSYALRSGSIGNNGSTTQTYTITVPEGKKNPMLSLDYRVSTEANNDVFRIFINDVEVHSDSGNKAWANVEKPLQTGTNKVRLEYRKNASTVSGSDTVWVDNIKVLTGGKAVLNSGWVTDDKAEVKGLEAGTDYEFRLVAKANGLETPPILMNNNVLQEVTDGIEALETDLKTADLTSREFVSEAKVLLASLKEMVEGLEAGEEKETLLGKVAVLDSTLEKAEQVMDATDAIQVIVVPSSIKSAEDLQTVKEAIGEAQEKIDALDEGEVKEDLQSRLDVVKKELEKAENIFFAKDAVQGLASFVENSESREAVAHAKEAIASAKFAVEKVSDETVKAELMAQITDLEAKILIAEQVLDAKEAVTALDEQVRSVNSFETLDVAKALVVTAEEKIAILEDGAVKVELATAVNETKATLEVIEYTLVTDKKLGEVEAADLSTSEAVADVKLQIEAVQERIKNILDEATQASFAERLDVVKEAVELAEAQFAVASLVDNPTEETLEEAKQQVGDVKGEAEKAKLTKIVEQMEDVLTMKARLQVIQKTNYTNLSDLDAVILELNGFKTKINGIQESDVRFGQKNMLKGELKKAKFHVGNELTDVLHETKKERYKGKDKGNLKPETLTFLVEHTVDKNIAVYIKDKVDFIFDYLPPFVEAIVNSKIRGAVHSELQPIIGSGVTGKQLNDMINTYLNQR